MYNIGVEEGIGGISLELTLECKQAIVDFLVEVLEPQIIYLYGSFARAEGRVDSDIDIAIYTEVETGAYKLFLLANQLAVSLKRDVELVDLKSASTVFRAQIISSGEALYYRNRTFKENYEVRALKEYAKLNEERSAILQAVREGGSVYGIGCCS